MSRYLLRCQALAKSDAEHVWPVLDAAFREFGLPLRLRSDNGPPFASAGVGGLSRLSVLVVKAGVEPERIAPGKPQQNGRHERMHLTLLQDAATPPAKSLREQLDRLRAFQRPLQRGAPAPGARQRHPGRTLSSLAPALGRRPARARLSGRPGGAARTLQRRDQMAGQTRLHQLRARRRAGRPRRKRRRLGGQLRPRRARRHRPWRRPLAQTQTRGLWTCGQRCALPTGSTATAAADQT